MRSPNAGGVPLTAPPGLTLAGEIGPHGAGRNQGGNTMSDAEAPIVLPCGCFHHIERGILNLCTQHLDEEIEVLHGTATPVYRPEEGTE